MDKEFGRYLMNDGRIHILSIGEYPNGVIFSRSVHTWPDGHSSDCQIPYPPQINPEEELESWVDKNTQNGNYVARIVNES